AAGRRLRASERVQTLEGGRVLRGFRRKPANEHLVRPLAERRDGSEVGRQRNDLASRVEDLLLDARVDVDVRTAEPVDRLLGVADDEQRARTKASVGPIQRA